MKTIHYLCYSDKLNSEGLVFPNELIRENYNPGLWIVDLDYYESLPEAYAFDAVEKNELITLKLIRVNRNVYSVKTQIHGIFYFRIMNLFFKYQKYVGKSTKFSSENRLLQVVPLNVDLHNKASLNEEFYFVGSIDEDLVQIGS